MDLQGRLVMTLAVYPNVLRKGKIIGKDKFRVNPPPPIPSVTFFWQKSLTMPYLVYLCDILMHTGGVTQHPIVLHGSTVLLPARSHNIMEIIIMEINIMEINIMEINIMINIMINNIMILIIMINVASYQR